MNRKEYSAQKLIKYLLILEGSLILLLILTLSVFNFWGWTNQSVLSFQSPSFIWFNLLAGFIYWVAWKNFNQINRFTENLPATFSHTLPSFKFSRFVFARLILFFLLFALAKPFYGERKGKATLTSMELVIALDVSNSMNTFDINKTDSRLMIAKRSINQLINQLKGEKIGLCIFAGDAFVQLPLTTDYPTAKSFVDEIESDMISNQGTNISEALRVAMNQFSKAKTGKGIILVTDGENHEENPEIVYQALKESDIEVCVLGIGTLKGGIVPKNPKRLELGYKEMPDGTPVVSKVNAKFIQEIGKGVNGLAVMTASPFPNLNQLAEEIRSMKHTVTDDIAVKAEDEFYRIPLFFTILLVFLSVCWNGILRYGKRIFNMKYIMGLVLFSNLSFAQSWKDNLESARKAYKMGAYQEALQLYYRVQKQQPNKAIDLQNEIAQTNYKLNRYQEAEKNIQQDVENKKHLKEKYHNLGNAYMQQKKYKDAIEAYKKSLKLNPENQQTRYNLSEAIRKLQNKQQSNNKNKPKNQPKKNQSKKDNKKKTPKKNEADSGVKHQLKSSNLDKWLNQVRKNESKIRVKVAKKKHKKGEKPKLKDW